MRRHNLCEIFFYSTYQTQKGPWTCCLYDLNTATLCDEKIMEEFKPSKIRILAVAGDENLLILYRNILTTKTSVKDYSQIGELALELYGKHAMQSKDELIELCCSKTSDEAIESVNRSIKSHKPFAVCFIDIHLPPGPNGVRLAESIRAKDPFIEIVMVTDYSHINTINLAERIPPAHKLLCIQKPFHHQGLLQLASALISKWLVEREYLNIQSELERRVSKRTAELSKERNFISTVLDTAGALIIVLDKEGRVVQYNRACEELSGYTFDEVKDNYIWDLFKVPEEVLPIKETFDSLYGGEFPHKHENYWVTRYGNRRLIAWSTTGLFSEDEEIEYGIWIGLDITERKNMEEEIRASEERYRALIENVKDGVALIREGKLLFGNGAFLSMFGYMSLDEIIGKDVMTLVDKEYESRFDAFLMTALDKRSWGLPFRGQCLRRDNSDFWAEILISVITYRGEPAILFTVRDITDNMLWEQTIKQEAEYFRNENVRLKSSIGERYRLGNIFGKSPAMQEVYEMILKAASNDANVIIYGKSGTGKELVSRAIHDMSDRADKNFVAVNCGAISENLIESEFFGYKKGAFTGAHMDKHGFLHSAHKGTLFLDEVGDIGLNMQVKLLRAIESGEYIPVGDNKSRTADMRIIAATNKDPMEMVRSGAMREDFFYRISVIPIKLPSLKERKEDIPLLVEHFLQKRNTSPKAIPTKVMEALTNYDWPGNVRELQNVLQRYLTVKSLDFMKRSEPAASLDFPPETMVQDKKMDDDHFHIDAVLNEVERKILLEALNKTRWNKTKAASMLGISRRSLFRRTQRLNVTHN